jgi:hypothetical protein
MACCRACSNGYEFVFGLCVCAEVNKLVEVGQTLIMIMCGIKVKKKSLCNEIMMKNVL